MKKLKKNRNLNLIKVNKKKYGKKNKLLKFELNKSLN